MASAATRENSFQPSATPCLTSKNIGSYEDKGSSIIEDLRETLNGLKCVYQSSQGDPPCGAQPGWVPDPERCDRYLSELPEDLFQALRCSWATTTTWVPPARMRAPACGPNSAAVD